MAPPNDGRDEVSTLLHARFGDADGPPPAFLLIVLEGPDAPASFALEGLARGRVLVGTSEVCDVRLTDPAVSRRHFALDRDGARLKLSDLDSTNGTVVNGAGMLQGYVGDGHVVRIGSTALRVEARAAEVETSTAPPADGFGRIVGESRAMRRLYPLCARLAASDVPVLIEGETGTGKEVLAESLHEEGPRAEGPFVVFDCTAVPPNLLEAELFGHERGAFTGAVTTRKGVFEQASGGTLLIDEIGDLDMSLQPKLLRVLERGEVRRLGGSSVIRVDVRILAATRRNLDVEVEAGRFRDDLFHRLVVTRLELPPLRERKGDVAVLARHFLRELRGDPGVLPSTLLARWADDAWPGNVRALRNAVARQIALGELVDTRDDEAPVPVATSDPIEQVLAMRLPLTLARQRMMAAFERRYIERALAESGGNVAHAARASGIARRYLQKLKARQQK